MRKGFHDTRVREQGLQRNILYTTLSSPEFALAVMFFIGLGTLLGALFPQGLDEAYYLARFGERMFRIYDSLGLLGVLRSWWFMLLFALLLVALVFCTYARVRERAFRVTKGTDQYESEFSVPASSEDVLLIFAVLLRSIGFRRKGVITEEGRSEITAVKGISPWFTSLMFHLSAIVLLVGLAATYFFSWGYVARSERGLTSVVPARARETRWDRLVGSSRPSGSQPEDAGALRIELLELRKHYESLPAGVTVATSGSPLSRVFLAREQLFSGEADRGLLLRGWGSLLRVTSGELSDSIYVGAGDSRMVFGHSVSQGAFSDVAHIEFPALSETLRVALPASVTREGVRLSISPQLLTQLQLRHGSKDSVSAAQPALRISASPAAEGFGYSGEIPEETVLLGRGDGADVGGLEVRVLEVFEQSLIRVRRDPGWSLTKLGALLVVLFCVLRLYGHWYTLRVELSPRGETGSYLKLRIRASGLLSSPPRVARKIASLLVK
ncbi:MAG: cytochrome c biogenesis protein ResB [Candidatus Eiseniibacteriota bacterium]|nr:MAG: cytochrome c biogenesis protein ResB [Candidatus Eisenbacteria bacterium]